MDSRDQQTTAKEVTIELEIPVPESEALELFRAGNKAQRIAELEMEEIKESTKLQKAQVADKLASAKRTIDLAMKARSPRTVQALRIFDWASDQTWVEYEGEKYNLRPMTDFDRRNSMVPLIADDADVDTSDQHATPAVVRLEGRHGKKPKAKKPARDGIDE